MEITHVLEWSLSHVQSRLNSLLRQSQKHNIFKFKETSLDPIPEDTGWPCVVCSAKHSHIWRMNTHSHSYSLPYPKFQPTTNKRSLYKAKAQTTLPLLKYVHCQQHDAHFPGSLQMTEGEGSNWKTAVLCDFCRSTSHLQIHENKQSGLQNCVTLFGPWWWKLGQQPWATRRGYFRKDKGAESDLPRERAREKRREREKPDLYLCF